MSGKVLVVEKKTNLKDEEKTFIFQSYGEGMPLETITAQLKKRFKVILSSPYIDEMCKHQDNRMAVDRFRDDYMSRLKDEPIANKRVRLNYYQNMVERMTELSNDINVKTVDGRKELLMTFRRINEVLCACREEMEGKSNAFTQINITELSSLSDEELQRRKEVLLARALGTFNEADYGIGEVGEGTTSADVIESVEVPLAAPKEL